MRIGPSGDVEITRKFYLESEDGDGPSMTCFFTVLVDAESLSVKEAYAINEAGNIFGEPAPEATIAP